MGLNISPDMIPIMLPDDQVFQRFAEEFRQAWTSSDLPTCPVTAVLIRDNDRYLAFHVGDSTIGFKPNHPVAACMQHLRRHVEEVRDAGRLDRVGTYVLAEGDDHFARERDITDAQKQPGSPSLFHLRNMVCKTAAGSWKAGNLKIRSFAQTSEAEITPGRLIFVENDQGEVWTPEGWYPTAAMPRPADTAIAAHQGDNKVAEKPKNRRDDYGIELFPPLQDNEEDQEKWDAFLSRVKENFEDSGQFGGYSNQQVREVHSSKGAYLKFWFGSEATLPAAGHRFRCLFSPETLQEDDDDDDDEAITIAMQGVQILMDSYFGEERVFELKNAFSPHYDTVEMWRSQDQSGVFEGVEHDDEEDHEHKKGTKDCNDAKDEAFDVSQVPIDELRRLIGFEAEHGLEDDAATNKAWKQFKNAVFKELGEDVELNRQPNYDDSYVIVKVGDRPRLPIRCHRFRCFDLFFDVDSAPWDYVLMDTLQNLAKKHLNGGNDEDRINCYDRVV